MSEPTPEPKEHKLTPKQEAFVEYYILRRNAKEAAVLAGYSENGAKQQGQYLLTTVNIQTAIQRRLKEKCLSADDVLGRLSDQAFASPEDFFDVTEDGGFKLNLKKAEERKKLHLIRKLSYNAQGQPTIELHDPHAALEDLGRFHKLFTDKNEVIFSNIDALIDRELAKLAPTGEAKAAPEADTPEP